MNGENEQEDNRSLAELFFEDTINQKQEEEQKEEEKQEEKQEEQKIEDRSEEKQEEKQQQEEKKEEVVVKAEKKKLWTEDYENTVSELLGKKLQYKSLSPEQKALAFIAKENPGLEKDEIEFLAATEFGIGVPEPDEADLTEAQIIELKKQGIQRKKLINQADSFFKNEAESVQLPEPDIDEDPEYTQYKKEKVSQAEAAKTQAETYAKTLQQVETTAKNITEIKDVLEIEIDDRKLPVNLNFKIDEAKQAKLIDFVKNYTPTKEEVAAFTEPVSGQFDYKGYMTSQASKVFAREILASGIKQAIAQDRAEFIEKELKNSTLRNNNVSETVDKKFDFVDAWPFGK